MTKKTTKKETMDNFSVMIQVFANIHFVDGKPTEVVVEPTIDADFFQGLDTDDNRRYTEDGYWPDSDDYDSLNTQEVPADIQAMVKAWEDANLNVPWRIAEHTSKERRRVINGHKVMVYPSGYPGQWVYLIDDTEGTPESFESEAETWGAAILHLDRMGALPPT